MENILTLYHKFLEDNDIYNYDNLVEVLSLEPYYIEFDEDFKLALEKVKQLGLKGIVFGNISSLDVREFYETRVNAVGLEYYDVLWGQSKKSILHETIIIQ